MAINFIPDTNGNIERAVKAVTKDYQEFTILDSLRFLYTFKTGDPQYDKDGLPVEAFAKKLSTRERDIYEKDVELCVHFDSWGEKTKDQKYRLIFCQLLSINIEIEGKEELEIVTDEDGRIKFQIINPDIIVKMYTRELEEFGLPSKYRKVVRTLLPKEKVDA